MRAFELKEQGWKQIEIAKALGVTRGAVSHGSGEPGRATGSRPCAMVPLLGARPDSPKTSWPDSPNSFPMEPSTMASSDRCGREAEWQS
jgi:hypothetical protein